MKKKEEEGYVSMPTCSSSSLMENSEFAKAAVKALHAASCWRENTLLLTPPPRGRACVATFFWWKTRPCIGQPTTLQTAQGWPMYFPSNGIKALNLLESKWECTLGQVKVGVHVRTSCSYQVRAIGKSDTAQGCQGVEPARVKVWPSNDIAITNIVWCMA